MASRNALKIGLCASVVLNVFLVAGAGTFWWTSKQAEKAVAQDNASRLSVPAMELIATRSPEVASMVKSELRRIAMTARMDYEEARAARRSAIDMTASDQFDPATVAALLEQSRASELRGRGRLEAGAVDMLSRLDAEDRKALAPLLSRKRPRHGDASENKPVTAEPAQTPAG